MLLGHSKQIMAINGFMRPCASTGKKQFYRHSPGYVSEVLRKKIQASSIDAEVIQIGSAK